MYCVGDTVWIGALEGIPVRIEGIALGRKEGVVEGEKEIVGLLLCVGKAEGLRSVEGNEVGWSDGAFVGKSVGSTSPVG